MKVDDFSKIFESMKKNDISEFVIKEGGKLYEIRRGGIKQNIVSASVPIAQALPHHAPVVPQTTHLPEPLTSSLSTSDIFKEQKTESKSDGLHEIKSPLVGTFYASPKPDAPLFVEIGDKVKKGQTLCIVEAMKNFNEIESDTNGIIREICANSSDLVEFGKVLFKIEV